ncbi:MAG TPA: replication factor C large subunit [Candidatus Thermoplasmatota archaeon]|nr:replication factor C large subunit [Candidatus Thermoplasmatota archaeon]
MAPAGLDLDWTEKYRPRSLEDVVGNGPAIHDLKAWAEAWRKGKPEQRGVLLAGDAGVGKTSAALALARDMGWGIVEMNASDQRNREAVERVATRGALSGTFNAAGEFLDTKKGGLKLIVLDEADALHGRDETMGGLRAIVDTLKRTEQPIALIVNDSYALTKRSSALKDLCLTIKFSRLRSNQVSMAIKRIVEAEGLDVEPAAIEALAEKADGDLRSAVKDLQALAQGQGRVTAKDVGQLGARDTHTDLWGMMGVVYRTRDPQEARRALREVDEQPRDALTWIEDNMPLWYTDPEDRARALQALSRADIYLGRTMRTQNYRLWSYASDLMSAGVALSKTRDYPGARLGFPTWIRRMGASKHARGMRKSLSEKLSRAGHTSRGVAQDEFLPFLQAAFRFDDALALRLALALELEEAEISFLLGDRATKANLKKFLAALEAAEGGPAVEEPEPEPEPAAETKPEKGPTQKGLFEF